MAEVQIGGRAYPIDEFSVYKGTVVLDMIGRLTDAAPGIFAARARFRQQYAVDNALVLDRVAARKRYTPEIVHEEIPLERDGQPVTETVDGEERLVFVARPVRDPDGALVYLDPLGHLTEQDWEASEQKLRLPKAPSGWEEVMATAKDVLKIARGEAFALVAAVLIPSSEFETADEGGGDQAVEDLIAKRARELKHKMKLADALDVLFTAAEEIGRQVGDQLGDIRGRLGNAARSLGVGEQGPETEPEIEPMHVETSRPPSSSDSASDSVGTDDSSSTAAASDSLQPSPVA